MTQQVLLIELGATALPATTPAPAVYGSWAPAVYVIPPLPVPAGFATTALADAVLLTWNAIAASAPTYAIERAPDVAGAPGAYAEIAKTPDLRYSAGVASGTDYWWRLRAFNFGRPSAYTAEIKMAAIAAGTAADVAAALAAAAAAQADATAANAKIADIASDSLITPGEKPALIQDKSALDAERVGIVAQADALVIVTERDAYTTALDNLTTYLATLTTPVAWNNISGNTNIT